jgi:hypothetical protein
MANTYRRISRAADMNFPYWVALVEEKCVGQNYFVVRKFCEHRGLSLSGHGHSVSYKSDWYQVFQFATDEDAECFCKEFGGDRMHPSEKGRGKHWSTWRKGTYKPKAKSPYDFSDD